MSEIWKPILNYEGIYEVSDTGKIRNSRTGKVLTPRVNNKGYQRVGLYKQKIQKEFLVHRLVATAFHGLSDDDMVVNHIDENKMNNQASNLEWTTPRKNTQHSVERMRKPKKHKEVFLYSLYGELIKVFPSIRAAGEYFGKSDSAIFSTIKNQHRLATMYFLGTSDTVPQFKKREALVDHLESYRVSNLLRKDELASRLGHTLHNYRTWAINRKIPHKELKKVSQLLGMTLDEAWDLNEMG